MARERNSEQAWATGGRLFAAITLIMLGALSAINNFAVGRHLFGGDESGT